MTASTAVVTPSASNEVDYPSCWLDKLESGALTTDDWDALSLTSERTKIPWLHEVVDSEKCSYLDRSERQAPLPQLVRTVGMVQDQLDLEFYATPTTTYPSSDDLHQKLKDRMPLVLTPLSTCTSWFQHLLLGHLSGQCMDNDDRPTKRLRLDEGHDYEHEEEESLDEDRCDSMSMDNRDAVQKHPPLVLAKMYYGQYASDRKLLLNELVEVIGVLELPEVGVPSEDEAFQHPQGSYDGWERDDAWTSNVPRLHVVWFQPTDLDQLLMAASTAMTLPSPRALSPPQVLARSLSVSDTTGSAIWMALMSVAERKELKFQSEYGPSGATYWSVVETPLSTTLGCASLNLILPDNDACIKMQDRLLKVLSQCVPQVQVINLSEPNALPTIPSKTRGRLQPSPLQLPKGSTLIINIGSHHPPAGSSTEWQALRQLTECHKMNYLFELAQHDYEADTRIVVLSTFQNCQDVPCTMRCVENFTEMVEASAPCDTDLCMLRNELARARARTETPPSSDVTMLVCPCNICLSSSVLDRAQQDFMQRRQRAREQQLESFPTEIDFHRWLTLTRLQARSRQVSIADIPDWEGALELDDAMISSLKTASR